MCSTLTNNGCYLEGGGLMLGLFETLGASWNAEEIPNDFSFGEIEPDWDSKSFLTCPFIF